MLGDKHVFGSRLAYFIKSGEIILGFIQFSASSWALSSRDKWIGWNVQDRILIVFWKSASPFKGKSYLRGRGKQHLKPSASEKRTVSRLEHFTLLKKRTGCTRIELLGRPFFVCTILNGCLIIL